jgi:hypothetical protein
MAEEPGFDSLRKERLGLAEMIRVNSFGGLQTVFADFYPDNAHFIYELLQNAEDALATTVEFALTRDRLTMTHNGKQPFTLRDIESITNIGNSTKKNDFTQIGKFGVGFKAVFAYTTRPEVRSGEYAFAIVDLFVPEELADRAKPGQTTFTFPFDREEKPPEAACAEVERGLALLDEKTLLFLNNISTITYELPDGTIGIIERQEIEDRVIRIKKSARDQLIESQWLRLTGPVTVDQDNPSPLTVAVAFLMKAAADSTPKRGRRTDEDRATGRLGSIVPLDDADVSIYFPAVKESSGLKFHIHAPFASTVARDSVRDDPGNVRLVDDIASVIVNALPGLCAEGLIGETFLAALPNSDDQIGYLYSPIRDAITEAFNSLEITPVRGNGGVFAPARTLASSPVEFRKWLKPGDLPVLFDLAQIEVERPPRWIRELDGRAGKFLAGLDALDFGWEELKSVLQAVSDVDAPYDRVWLAWLESKSDDEITSLYELLGQGFWPRRQDLETISMVRLVQEGKTRHVKGPDTHLPSDRSDSVQSHVPAALAYFDDDENEERANNLKAFYRAAGVKRWDESARIEQRLAVYRDKSWQIEGPDDLVQHLDDVRRFVQFGLTKPTTAMNTFGWVSFLQAVQSDDSVLWVTPRQTFVDLPFSDTGLSALHPRVKMFHNRSGVFVGDAAPYPLAGIYIEVDQIEDFMAVVGAQVGLAITEARVTRNAQFSPSWRVGKRENAHGVKMDWNIDRLDDVIAGGNPSLLRTLWRAIVLARESKAMATYQANGSAQTHDMDSQLLQALKARRWVPDRDGALKTPGEMTLKELPDDWAKLLPAGVTLGNYFFVNKLCFGSQAAQRIQKRDEVAKHLRDAGLDEGIYNLMIEWKNQGLPLEEIGTLVEGYFSEKTANLPFPVGASDDPVRRAGIAAIDALNAPHHATEVRERSVVIGQKQAANESKAYLREHYTTASGDMFCQVCQKPLPFKTKDGRWYFEALRFVTGRRQIHTPNAIALCPLCAALYNHARATDDEQLLEKLFAIPVEASQITVEVPVVLDGERVRIQFTGKHAIDIQAALRVAGDDRKS